jgi:hypothetical protein
MQSKLQYNNIAKKFVAQYKNPRLKEFLKNAIPNQKPNFYFNVKSEILRISKECNRIIDLRDKIKDEEVHEITFNNLTHYLNDSGLKEFERVSDIYQNRFTFGVYEAVLDRIKEIQKEELLAFEKESLIDKEEEKRSLEYINFNEFNLRNEESMFFAVEIKIYDKNENSLSENIKRIKGFYNRNEYLEHKTALTTDISASGLNIKIPENINYSLNSHIIIRMTGIEKELVFNTPYIEYQVVKINNKNKFNYISLKKIDNELNKEVDIYISNIINGYKKKYKIDLSHVIKSVRSKGYEQFYMSKFSDCSFLFSKKRHFLIPKFEYVNNKKNDNFSILKKGSNLARAFLHSRMDNCIENKNKGEFYFMFFYTIKDNKRFFYSLSTNNLNDNEVHLFINYGMKEKNLKVFKCSYTKIDAIKDAFTRSPLPITVLQNISPNSLELSPKIKDMIKDIEYIINFNNITSSIDNDFYNNKLLKQNNFNEISHCLVKKYSLDPIMEIKSEKTDFRIEDRFNYNTNLTITYKNKEYKGYTTDISFKGLRIKLDDKIFFERNPKIKINFEDYTNQMELSLNNLDYRVVNSKDKIILCNASGDLSNHNGVSFLKKFIYKNYYKMKITGSSNEILGLSEAIKNIVSQNYTNLPTFFEIKNKQINPFMISGYNEFLNNFNLFKYLNVNENNLDELLKPLFFNQNFLEQMLRGLSFINENEEFQFFNYYINVKIKNNKPFFKFLFEEQVGSSKEKDLFLNPTDGSKSFVFRLNISKKNRMMNKYFKHEIMYIESYYVHKSEEIYKELNKVNGIIEFTDITDFINIQNKYKLNNIS